MNNEGKLIGIKEPFQDSSLFYQLIFNCCQLKTSLLLIYLSFFNCIFFSFFSSNITLVSKPYNTFNHAPAVLF